MSAIGRGNVKQIKNIIDALSPQLRKLAEKAIKKLTSKADDWIAKQCKGSVRNEFPKELLNKTLEEIKKCKTATCKKAWKLLNDKRFTK